MPLSPFAGPGEKRFPDDYLDTLTVTKRAMDIVGDLHHEAQAPRMYGIAQHHLNRFREEIVREMEADFDKRMAERDQQTAYDPHAPRPFDPGPGSEA